MHLYAPFDGTVVEKQGEDGEIISPTAMSSSLGRTAVVTIANLEKMDVETENPTNLISGGSHWASPPWSPSARSRRERYRRPAAAGAAHGRPDPRHRQGEGRDPRPR